jgi:23S rRNA (uridine2552-2'-O)-methyltransferase
MLTPGPASQRAPSPCRQACSWQVAVARHGVSFSPPQSLASAMPPQNPTGKKHKFGKAWMHEHLNDPYVQEAQRRGYRSRAAFKLIEIAERDKLLKPGITAVDLGSSPGSWSQVLRERLGSTARLVAIDLLPMDGIAGVTFIQGDFRSEEGLAAVRAALSDGQVDLVVSDMAPNLSGIESADQARSVHLGELALEFAVGHLRPGGDLLVKVFQGAGLPEFQRAIGQYFAKVYVRKPKSSRDRSRETFLVGKGYRG